MQVALRLQPTARQVLQVRTLPLLLAVNAVLPLPVGALLNRVEEELELNPALTRTPYPCAACGAEVQGIVCAGCGQSVVALSDRLRWSAGWLGARIAADAPDRLPSASSPPSLTDWLMGSLSMHLNDACERRIGQFLIGSLDHRGYVDADLNLIAADLKVPPEKVERVLAKLQTLDPPGVGARSLRECLLIQLQDLPEDALQALATRIVDVHLDEIARGAYEVVASALGTTVAQIRAGLTYIRQNLHPWPAERFYAEHGGKGLRPEDLVVPDVILARAPSGYGVVLNGEPALALRVAPSLRVTTAAAESVNAAGGTGLLAREYLRQARFFVEVIRRRNQTLRQCMEHIVDVQKGFLEHGPSALRALTRKAVASALGLSESTVCRACEGKFVQLPSGRVVGIGVFFDRAQAVRERLKTLLARSAPDRPSDRALSQALASEGVVIARRTVTKYRHQIGLPPSSNPPRVRGIRRSLGSRGA